MTTCLFFTSFFPRLLENFILYFSRTFKWPFALQRDVIFSSVPLFSTAACPLNVDKFAMPARARVEEKGFSCLEENVLRTVTIEMIGKFLPPLSTLPLSSRSSPFCFRHSSRIASPRYCAHKRITTYTSAYKIFMYVCINRESALAL